MGIDQPEVVLTSHVAMKPLPVDHHKNIAVAQAVHLHLRAHIILIEGKRAAEHTENVLNALSGKIAQHAPADNLCLNRGVFQQVLRTGTCHHHFGQRAGHLFLGLCNN